MNAFACALKELDEEGGVQERYRRYLVNQKSLVEGMRSLGFKTLINDEFQSPIITSFHCPDFAGFDFQDPQAATGVGAGVTAIIIDDKAVIPNLGHPSRDGEQNSVAEYLEDYFEIEKMPKGATLDGGDVIFYDDEFLIGISSRTNRAGAEFLSSQAKKADIGARIFKVPESTLHLTTVFSSPRPGTIIAAEGHFGPGGF